MNKFEIEDVTRLNETQNRAGWRTAQDGVNERQGERYGRKLEVKVVRPANVRPAREVLAAVK